MGRGGLGHEAAEAQEGPVAAGGGEDKLSTAKRGREIRKVGASRAVGEDGMGREAARCFLGERAAVEEAEDQGEAEAAASGGRRLSFHRRRWRPLCDVGRRLCASLAAVG